MCDSTDSSEADQGTQGSEPPGDSGSGPAGGSNQESDGARPGGSADLRGRFRVHRSPSESESGQESHGAGSSRHIQGDQSREVRFLVDSTAGRLVRWLRLLGFDSAYSEHAADYRLAHRARGEGRILLTRRRSAAALPWAEAVLLESDCLDEQLVQIAHRFPLPEPPLSRCSLCNALLNSVSKEDVRAAVPPFVYKTASGFSKCPGCGHVYWQGTHCSKITSRWKELRRLPRSG